MARKLKTIEQKRKTFLIPKLRRMSMWWKPRTEVIQAAQLERGMYQCQLCKTTHKRHELVVDHIQPVIDLEGFTTWDDYINSLFCDINNLQAICHSCHDAKTLIENQYREIKRNSVKSIDKKKKKV